ncbi:MAG: adenylate/guanylate cyclase domain-containing protein, partial [Chloroflexota bacterium]
MSEEKFQADQMWREWFMTDAKSLEKRQFNSARHFFQALPHDPRCKFCNAPFEGLGAVIARVAFRKERSTLNPQFCNICETFARQFPGGAEVEMSMLFADVRGSTALSEQMAPMDFQRLINRFYVMATKAIIEEEGLVEKLAGDAVAAFWGAGFAGPEYVRRTVNAAQNMLRVMGRQNIPVGIGVHAGVAFFGAMGT